MDVRARRRVGYALFALVLATLVPRPAAAKPGCKHTVKKGDTVSRIARKHGVSEANLIRANSALKKNPNRLRIGQELEICRAKRLSRTNPRKCGDKGRIVRHQVDRGDTLSSISKKYSVGLKSLRKYNKRLRRSTMIRVGETVLVCTTSRRWTNRSWLSSGVQLPEGPGYKRRPHHAWGTQLTIDAIVSALRRYREQNPDAPVVEIGDISRKQGGPLGSHLSHQEGRDVDVFFVFEANEDARKRKVDVAASWPLLQSFLEDDAKLAAVFVDYRLQGRLYEHAKQLGVPVAKLDAWFEYPTRGSEAVVYHWPGHTGHFHARFVSKLADVPEGDAVMPRPDKPFVMRGGISRLRAVVGP